MAICKVPIVSDGYPGAPGYTTFYVRGPDFSMSVIHTFFEDLKSGFPTNVTYHFPLTGVQIDEETGDLAGSWTAGSAEADVVGTDDGGYAAPTGVGINWLTGEIRNTHQVRGRTFLVPFGFSSFGENGYLTQGAVDILQVVADDLLNDLDDSLVVWHRPKGATPGEAIDVVAAKPSVKAAVLRSRRP